MTQTIAVTDPHVYLSPGNWYVDPLGAYALAPSPGAYLRLLVSTPVAGTSVILDFDTSSLAVFTAAACPTIVWSLDGRPFQTWTLPYSTNTQRLTLGSSLTVGTHIVELHYKAHGIAPTPSYWNPPNVSVRITGVEIDASAALLPPAVQPLTILWYGDSISAGFDVSGAQFRVIDNDATQTAVPLVARALGAEYGVIGWTGQGYVRGIGDQVDGASYPNLLHSWDSHYAGASRLAGGLLVPQPDYIFVALGQNDAALQASDVTAVLAAILAAAPTAKLFACANPSGTSGNAAAITAGVAALGSSRARAITDVTQLIRVGSQSNYSNDSGTGGSHPNTRGDAHYAAELVNRVTKILAGG